MMHSVLMMTVGYTKRYRWQDMRDKTVKNMILKYEHDTILIGNGY